MDDNVRSDRFRVETDDYLRKTYSVSKEIGRGGMGVVYAATRIADGLPVAIKRIPSHRVAAWGTLNGEMVPLEVVLLVKVDEVAGVARLVDLCVDKHRTNFFLVLEKPGNCSDLWDFVNARRLSNRPQLTRTIFRRVVEAVMECRRRGVFHGDIKDENVIVDLDNNDDVKLIDFGGGGVWPRGGEKEEKKTKKRRSRDDDDDEDEDDETTHFGGTKTWAPPEAVRTRRWKREPSTVWTLGCLLYVMLYGVEPFQEESAKTSAPHFPEDAVSSAAKDLILKCLVVREDKRMTLGEILQHPWMAKSSCQEEESLPTCRND